MDYRMPLYQQIKAAIQKKIENKEYLEGAAIPSERKLAEIYEVNRMTAKKAIDALVEEGYLYRVQGRGTFVHKENTQKIIWGNDALGLGAMLREKADTRRDKVLVKGLLKAFNFLGSKLLPNMRTFIYYKGFATLTQSLLPWSIAMYPLNFSKISMNIILNTLLFTII